MGPLGTAKCPACGKKVGVGPMAWVALALFVGGITVDSFLDDVPHSTLITITCIVACIILYVSRVVSLVSKE